ncbi:MAG TPA: hypothetical protein VFP91_13110 [Vicinamibacterales bacterium]|nr:hypothetical protein [Vicinamibacterales bacterium]
MKRKSNAAVAVLCVLLAAAVIRGQHAGTFKGLLDDPAIAYSTTSPDNVVSALNMQLREGRVQFAFDARTGFLQSTLDALHLPVDSQLLVFSRGSLQGRRIGEQNPRAIFFNDRVALGWVRGGDVIEVAALDPRAGLVFYTLEQHESPSPPQFKRRFECLGCHVTGDTLGVPGLLMFSTTRAEPGRFDGVPHHIDHSDPFDQRFGGWFVTGKPGAARHMGNNVAALDGRSSRELDSVAGLFDTDGYRSLSSDIAAHLVLTHQAAMTNLLTRAAFEARVAQAALSNGATSEQTDAVNTMMTGIAREVVDHLLFDDEAQLPAGIHSGSGFAERFSASGPRDRKGRSLYELDLTRRLMKYRCSYLIYSPAFDALPPIIKSPIYRRLRDALAGRSDSFTILDILRETKSNLPPYFF